MDRITSMRVFVRAATDGSLSAAARHLGISPAMATKHVNALEARLGVKLFHRSTRRLALTEAGNDYLEACQRILPEIDEADAAAVSQRVKASGVLRMNVPLSFGHCFVAPLMPAFSQRHPEVTVELGLSDAGLDLIAGNWDLAIRIGHLADSPLQARQLGDTPMRVCASPGYLATHGHPAHPDDLAAHATMSYSYLSSGDTWSFRNTAGAAAVVRIRPAVHATNGDLLRRLAIEDGGIIVQPAFIVADDIAAGRLIQVLPDWTLGEFALYAVYLSRRHLSAKVRVFIDYLVEQLGAFPT